MNVDIAKILKAKIAGLNFVDKISGLVRPVIKIDTAQDEENEDFLVRKVFPVACDVSKLECENDGRYNDLVPNDKDRTIIYFEDRGVSPVSREGRLYNFRSRLRLVCWINLDKFSTTECSLSGLMAAIIMKQFPQAKFNSGIYQQISVVAMSEAPKTQDIFGEYTYSEETNQYLLYPYDYFAIDIETIFSIREDCIEDDAIDVTPKAC